MIDRIEFPRGFKFPTFTLFSGDGSQSIVKHIAKFRSQCADVGSKEVLKLRLFASSLTNTSFIWFINLAPNLIQNWAKMEDSFHAQCFQTEPEVSMADLARLSQRPNEKATQLINRSERVRTKCKIILLEPEFVKLA